MDPPGETAESGAIAAASSAASNTDHFSGQLSGSTELAHGVREPAVQTLSSGSGLNGSWTIPSAPASKAHMAGSAFHDVTSPPETDRDRTPGWQAVPRKPISAPTALPMPPAGQQYPASSATDNAHVVDAPDVATHAHRLQGAADNFGAAGSNCQDNIGVATGVRKVDSHLDNFAAADSNSEDNQGGVTSVATINSGSEDGIASHNSATENADAADDGLNANAAEHDGVDVDTSQLTSELEEHAGSVASIDSDSGSQSDSGREQDEHISQVSIQVSIARVQAPQAECICRRCPTHLPTYFFPLTCSESLVQSALFVSVDLQCICHMCSLPSCVLHTAGSSITGLQCLATAAPARGHRQQHTLEWQGCHFACAASPTSSGVN